MPDLLRLRQSNQTVSPRANKKTWDDQWYPLAMPGNKMDRSGRPSMRNNDLVIGMIKVESRFEEKSEQHELSMGGGKEAEESNEHIDFLMGELGTSTKDAPDEDILNQIGRIDKNEVFAFDEQKDFQQAKEFEHLTNEELDL